MLLAREPHHERGVTPALVPVANRPLLLHALDWLERGGVRDVAIVASDRVADHAWEAVGDGQDWSFRTSWLCAVPGESLGESLGALTGFVQDDPFVLHLADSLTADSFSDVLGDASVGDDDAVVLTHSGEGAMAPVVDIRSRRRTHGGRAAGVAVVGGAVLGTTQSVDAQPGLELNEIVSHVSHIGGNVEFRSADTWWRFHEDVETMLEGNRLALSRLRRAPVDAKMRDSVVQGPVHVDPSAELISTTVRGPAVIGPGARLESAYIGPFTSVDADVVIEGAEVENSILRAGSSITHLSTRVEGSVVGPGARVFRDFRLPRAMRLNLGAGAEVAIT